MRVLVLLVLIAVVYDWTEERDHTRPFAILIFLSRTDFRGQAGSIAPARRCRGPPQLQCQDVNDIFTNALPVAPGTSQPGVFCCRNCYLPPR